MQYKIASLILEGCSPDVINGLPQNMRIRGTLDLEGCTGLTILPKGLKVGFGLNLIGCTNLTSLPEGLTVGAGLLLEGCTSLTSLPADLRVKSKIYVGYTQILPQNVPEHLRKKLQF